MVALTGLGAAQNGVVRTSAEQISDTSPPTEAAVASTPSSSDDLTASTLASGSLLRTIGAFWLAGLLLAFTPCVLPMVPILSSLIAGRAGPVSRGKGFGLALAYSLGMAIVYAAFGVAAGLAGEGLAAALQNPWVLGAFALLMCGLALSMFGFYELQMPSAIQGRATAWSNRLPGGSFMGVFVMGGISALVVGPCVAAPLAGALVYISKTQDVLLGGSALFAMALGMSVPLLLVGVSAGSVLPRAGRWMERIKQLCGMVLLGVAIWMVSPALPPAVHMLLWAVWLLASAALLGLFGATRAQHAPPSAAARASGAALAALAAVLLVGAASGGQSVLQPLGHLRTAQAGGRPSEAARPDLQFERVATVQELDTALSRAKQAGQVVMLDFYADWCVACKEFDSFTLSDPAVQKRLRSARLLRADVTANSTQDKALLKRFNLFGPPGIVFFDGSPDAAVTHKVVGFQGADEFVASLQRAWPRQR
jgi:thiol:disulfide interchange protein DsbD